MNHVGAEWKPWSVEQAVQSLTGAPFRWWISGGHALALHLGTTWRLHDDLDVGVCRDQLDDVFDWLTEWDLAVAAAGRLTPWQGQPLSTGRHENNVWARESPEAPWRIDFTVSAGDERRWVYRRDPSISRPWERAVLTSPAGVRYLAPDLQLLFKSKHARPKDDVDADVVIPALRPAERRFLARHLPPGHPWRHLAGGSASSAES